jgi:virginiamycin B lyase
MEGVGVSSWRQRGARTAAIGTLVAAAVLLLAAAPRAEAYIYWANQGTNTIARANLDGTDANLSFITGASLPNGVAVDAAHLYWVNQDTGTIGRANLDGSGVNHNLITGLNDPEGVAVDASHIYWADAGTDTIGRANLDGTGPDFDFIPAAMGTNPIGVAVDAAHIYWSTPGGAGSIRRANLDGMDVNPSFITGTPGVRGVAVDAAHIYWASTAPHNMIGRANLDGTAPKNDFIPAASSPGGVAADVEHLYWANFGGDTIGRASLDGNPASVNQSFIGGASDPSGLAVDALPLPPGAPRNDFSLGKAKRNKNKGTAKLPAVVPGPGELVLAGKKVKPVVEQAVTRASRGAGIQVVLKVRARGKGKQKLNRTGKAKVTMDVTYTPTGGQPNTLDTSLRLIKRR